MNVWVGETTIIIIVTTVALWPLLKFFDSLVGKMVCQEVRSILSPLPFSARVGSPGSSSRMLERRPKRKSKSRMAVDKYGHAESQEMPQGRKPAPTFQKKLVVIDYMGGAKAPRTFAVKGRHVWIRGILPEIAVTATEEKVHQVVGEVISNCDSALGQRDFEFMEASGKCLCVPAQNKSFEWTGRAVKQLAGTGAVYVRLTTERECYIESEVGSSDDSLYSLPDVKIKRENAGNYKTYNNVV